MVFKESKFHAKDSLVSPHLWCCFNAYNLSPHHLITFRLSPIAYSSQRERPIASKRRPVGGYASVLQLIQYSS